MKKSSVLLRVGSRPSTLALLQTSAALDRIKKLTPALEFELSAIATAGDMDRTTDLRQSPPDFFTRELDAALFGGKIDCAVHSAKDMPYPAAAGLDWFWLPWREDPRDALVLPKGRGVSELPASPVIGVSSARRAEYCRKRFPAARLASVRGNIEERLALLDSGKYDALIMAGAALLRLGLEARITEWIPLNDLPVPEGQGALAMTFRAGDERLMRLRGLFAPAVVFAGAGVGSAGLCTAAALHALEKAQVCIHDSLMPQKLLERLPGDCLRINAGKRCGNHGLEQLQITDLLAKYARQGLRVVRLKGGDPGIFGRLAEEVEALEALGLAYHVIPGVSSLQAATTGSGMLLTRRGGSRGFCAMTPRAAGGEPAPITRAERGKLPVVFFMSARLASEIARELLSDGEHPALPAAMVFNAGADDRRIVAGCLADFAGSGPESKRIALELEKSADAPALFIAGECAGRGFKAGGALRGMRVLLTCSSEIVPEAERRVLELGGTSIFRPMTRLMLLPESAKALQRVHEYDWLVVPSPTAARFLAEALKDAGCDARRLPRIMACGPGTAAALKRLLMVNTDIQPEATFGAEGLVAAATGQILAGERVLRLRSDKAGPGLAEALQKLGAAVEELILYTNKPIKYDSLPEFDAVFFAAASAAEAYIAAWGVETLLGKTVAAIGKPTADALLKAGRPADVVSPVAAVEDALTALAGFCLFDLRW